MAKTKTYAETEQLKYAVQLTDMLRELPAFTTEYFNAISFAKQPRTQLAYATDLRNFFRYLTSNVERLKSSHLRTLSLSDLGSVTTQEISNFLMYQRAYSDESGKMHTNGERALKRKLCSIRGMYNYFYRMEKIADNPAERVEVPKIHDKAIVRMDPNEVAELLDNVESGSGMTKEQLRFHGKLKGRDLALLTLMLGTGIRVSECVGLDIKDVDFDNDRIRVIRKGGAEAFVYFGDEVRDTLSGYMEERKFVKTREGHENALFVSQQGSRLGVRSVELLVKKYAQTVTTVKHITPHKLRSTYGTNLYQESHDIYLVADVLGHKDVNTTRKHYADLVDENKRSARNMVRLRKD